MKKAAIKTQSLKEQSAWLLIAKVIGFVLSFFLPLLIVRYLSQENVGIYRESFLIITNAVVLLPLGFSMSAYYFLARESARRGPAILNILLFNFVVGGLACLLFNLYPKEIGDLFRSTEIARLAPQIGIVIWIWIFAAFLETVAIANSEVRAATGFIVFASLSKTVFLGAAVLVFATVESFLYAAIIQGVLQLGLLAWYLTSRFPHFWRGFDPRFFWEQIRYAIPFGLTGILYMAQYEIHNYFVVYKFSYAEFAIYAYGCFQVPLIAMLSESVTAVLMSRMNELQQVGDTDEMLRLTTRAMQKLAFLVFPIYVFLFVTAHTFIITLFTRDYEMSASIFAINLTLLPLGIMITDPVVRSFKELGRPFLLTRIVIVAAMIGVLYFALGSLSMTGMVTVAVVAILVEKLVTETMVFRKLGFARRHLPLLANVGKTAVAAVFAGLITFIVYANLKDYLLGVGEHFAEEAFSTTRLATLNLVGGSLVLFISAAVYIPVYLIAANLSGVIEENERQSIRNLMRRVFTRRNATPAENQI